MYLNNEPESRGQLENQRILEGISESPLPAEDLLADPEAKAAFDESLRQLAEDIIEFNPSLAHVLLGMGEENSKFDSIHGQN